ncbi:MAG: hypothetical protein KME31_19095 [Tolypothrix carrinoi HA7290-LM1]|nr:hypothetical protein [Tolypothrix carrinoi HA7290-LM1]
MSPFHGRCYNGGKIRNALPPLSPFPFPPLKKAHCPLPNSQFPIPHYPFPIPHYPAS